MLSRAIARWACVICVLALTGMVGVEAVWASPPAWKCSVFSNAKVELSCARGVLRADTFWLKRHERTTWRVPQGERVMPEVAAEFDRSLSDHLWLERMSKRWIAAAKQRLVPSIAHLALWKCIAGYPGFRPGGGTGESGGYVGASNGTHFNILQMTAPWGQGAYYVADPTVLSPEQIMEKAEIGYETNRYSRSWLNGQWGQTIDPCWGFA